MKNITQATQNRIRNMGNIYKHSFETECEHNLGWVLDEVMSQEGYEGATISECKKWGKTFDNEFQINVPEYMAPFFIGLSINQHDCISATFCADLHHITVRDFNGLVKALYDMRG